MTCEKYIQPLTLDALTVALSRMTEDSVILAGGTDLIIALRKNHRAPDCILSLCSVKEMKGICRQGTYIRIGAMETHGAVAENPLVKQNLQALAMACDHVGSKQIRNKGTIGGNLANASVAGDILPVMCLLHGLVEIMDSSGSTRKIQAEDLLMGAGKTVLKPGEVILAVWLPLLPERNSCFVKLGGRKEVTIADISLAMSWEIKNGRFHNVEGVLGAVDTKPVYLTEANALLGDRRIQNEDLLAFSESLSKRIRTIRENRSSQPRLRILECEKVYKEAAVKGVVYDVFEMMKKYSEDWEAL